MERAIKTPLIANEKLERRHRRVPEQKQVGFRMKKENGEKIQISNVCSEPFGTESTKGVLFLKARMQKRCVPISRSHLHSSHKETGLFNLYRQQF